MSGSLSLGELAAPARAALADFLLRWADDELVLGHRDSEWTGFAPQIEEDVAFSSIAQDELGHAALLYGLVAELTGDDPDRLALRRGAAEYRHCALVERANGDWAHTIARHYLYDLADAQRAAAMSASACAQLAGIAARMAREEHYHRLHGAAWWERLGAGTAESRERLVAALRTLLPLAAQVLAQPPGEVELLGSGLLSCPHAAMLAAWQAEVEPLVAALDPTLGSLIAERPAQRHARDASAEFIALHAEMTAVSMAGLGERW